MKYLATVLLILGFGLSAFGQTIKSLGYNTTNGQVVANMGTNVLTFTNRPLLKGVDTTNIPTLFWQTSDGVGDGAMLAFSRRHATNLWFGINQTNWSQGAWGQNIQPAADGNNFTRKNTNLGSVALVLENEYNAEQNTNNPPLTVAEMYFDVTDTSGQRTRPLMFVGSQTNSALGWGYSVYPLTVGITNLGWNAASAFQVDYNNPSGGGTMVLKNLSTSGGSYAELQMVSGGGTALILQKQNRFDLYANNVSYGNIIQALTNGVVIGSSSFKSAADARVQLGGDTRVDGAISFNATSNAATTRTNLDLGLPALTNTSNANFRSAVGVAPAPIFKVLTNDLSITNQTNMTVVDGLTFTTEANKRYIVQLFPILSASASSMPLQIVASNATVYGFWDAQATLGLSTNVITNVFSSSVTVQRALLQTFHVVAGTNNGSIAFQFATITTPNTNTVHAGSYMMAQEIVPTP